MIESLPIDVHGTKCFAQIQEEVMNQDWKEYNLHPMNITFLDIALPYWKVAVARRVEIMCSVLEWQEKYSRLNPNEHERKETVYKA